MDDGWHLLIVDLIITFYSIETLSVKHNEVPLPILPRLLGEDHSGCKVQAICLHAEWKVVIRGDKDGL